MSPKTPVAFVGMCLVALLALTGWLAAEPLVQFGFEEAASLDAWNSTDPEAVLTVARDPDNVRVGEGALQFSYFPREDTWFIVQTAGLDMVGARSLSFSVKTSEATPLIVGLGEQDGSHYDAFIECPENEWVDVKLNISDLLLRRGDEDENGKLDPEEVTDLSFLDCSNMKGEEGRALGWKRGQQYMWLDDIVVDTNDAPSATRVEKTPDGMDIVLGTHTADQINALAVGGAKLTLVKDGDAAVLKIQYGAGAQRWAGCVTGIGQLDLRGLKAIRLKLRAPENVKAHVQLEERDGSKYEAVLQLEGKAGWQTPEVNVADFRLGDTSTDENEQLDLGQLRVMVLVVDTFTSMVGGGGTGALSVDDIVLACGEPPAAAEEKAAGEAAQPEAGEAKEEAPEAKPAAAAPAIEAAGDAKAPAVEKP